MVKVALPRESSRGRAFFDAHRRDRSQVMSNTVDKVKEGIHDDAVKVKDAAHHVAEKTKDVVHHVGEKIKDAGR
jgi:hypothetical protein